MVVGSWGGDVLHEEMDYVISRFDYGKLLNEV